jgi:hypothetical protein
MEKVAKNGRNVKPIALIFCCFLPIYERWKKSLKMDEKLRLAIALLFYCFLPIDKNGKSLAYVSKRYLVPSNFVDLGIFIYMNICIYIYICWIKGIFTEILEKVPIINKSFLVD